MDSKLHETDVYGPADCWGPLPEGTTVGTTYQFVAFAVGYGREYLLLPDDAERLAALLVEAAKKVREQRLTSSQG